MRRRDTMHPLEALKVLGLDQKEELTEDDVKIAYRREAMKHHPDKQGDSEKFKRANRAYKILARNVPHAKQFIAKKTTEPFLDPKVVDWTEIFSGNGPFRYSHYTGVK